MNNIEINKYLAIFNDKKYEYQYRQENLNQDKTKINIFLSVGLIVNSLLIITDYISLLNTELLYLTAFSRVIFNVLLIVLFFLVKNSNSATKNDYLMFGMIMAISIVAFVVNSTRSSSYNFNLIIDGAILLCFYVLIPSKIILQITAAAFLTFVELILILLFKDLPINSIIIFIITFFFLNILGYMVNRQNQISKRLMFQAYHNEIILKNELTNALENINKLEGLLPICSSCKQIRIKDSDTKDQKNWIQIEKYISDRTDADFSHGICPKCAEKLYGDFLKGKD